MIAAVAVLLPALLGLAACSSGDEAKDSGESPTVVLDKLQDALAAGEGQVVCRYVTDKFWKGFAIARGKDSCEAIADYELTLPGRFKEQIGTVRVTSVKTEGDTANVKFTGVFGQGLPPRPWELTMQRQLGQWRVDTVCALPAPGQQAGCTNQIGG